jgi:hypothetical protein
MTFTKLASTPALLTAIALTGCIGAPSADADGPEENVGEAQEAICSGDYYDALVHFGGGSPGTAYISASANPTDQYSTCTGRYVVNVDDIDYDDSYNVVAGYAGPTPTNQTACAATRVTAKAYGRLNDWGSVISFDQTASGLWLGSFCLVPRITMNPGGQYNAVQIRVKAYTVYHGVETAQKGYAGVIVD